MDGKLFCREDIRLTNSRGHNLQCSHYHRESDEDTGYEQEPSPCVVYLHGNCGSRVDADEVVEGLLDRGLAVFSLDFAGCGLSDGEYVSLGYFEQDDLITALKHLQQDPMTTAVGVWGRSMGSVAALMVGGSADYKEAVGCLVVDSPYASLRSLLDDLAHKYVPKVPLVPYDVVVEATVQSLREDVSRRASFDLLDVDADTPSRRCVAPALFAHSLHDYLVPIEHSRRLVESYGGEAHLVELVGDHNSARDLKFLESVYEFLATNLRMAPPAQQPERDEHAEHEPPASTVGAGRQEEGPRVVQDKAADRQAEAKVEDDPFQIFKAATDNAQKFFSSLLQFPS